MMLGLFLSHFNTATGVEHRRALDARQLCTGCKTPNDCAYAAVLCPSVCRLSLTYSMYCG